MNRPTWIRLVRQLQPASKTRSRSVGLLVLAVALVCIAASSRTVLAQWGLLSDQRELLGKAIVDVGKVESEYSRSASRFDRRYGYEWLRFQGQQERCFDASGFSVSGSQAALLLVDESRTVYLAVLKTGIGSLDIDVGRARVIECER